MNESSVDVAKRLAENVTQSNVAAIITVLLFLVFILVMFWLNSKQKVDQDASMTKRDEMLSNRFGSLLDDSNRKYAQMVEEGNRKAQITTDQFTKSIEGMHQKTEEMGKQMMNLMVDTIKTLAVVGETVKGVKEELIAIKRSQA